MFSCLGVVFVLLSTHSNTFLFYSIRPTKMLSDEDHASLKNLRHFCLCLFLQTHISSEGVNTWSLGNSPLSPSEEALGERRNKTDLDQQT